MTDKKISKAQALELLHEMMYGGRGIVSGRKLSLVELQLIRYSYEALEQQPKIGHWIEVTNGRGGHECDVCHDYAPSFQSGNEYLSAFCPNCGADMREVRENDR